MAQVASAAQIVEEERKARVRDAATTTPAVPLGTLPLGSQAGAPETPKDNDRQNDDGGSRTSGGPPKMPNKEGELPQVIIEDRLLITKVDLTGEDEALEAEDAANRAGLEAGDWPENVVVDDDAVDGYAVSDASNGQPLHAVPNATYVISPRKNILDQYASYNYNIGWYLLPPNVLRGKSGHTPFDFRQYVLLDKYLLAQSGGALQRHEDHIDISFPGSPYSADKRDNLARNPYFNLDYYIDSLEIETLFPGRATRLSNTQASIKFTLHEPNGITLTKNLFNAVQDVHRAANQKISIASAHYALVIRFYGYDENGKIVKARDKDSTDSQAVVEKFIPFRLATINFRIASRVTEYAIQGIAIPYSIGGSSSRGTIQSHISLTGSTVKDILVGKPVRTQYAESDGRRPALAPVLERDIHDEGKGSDQTSVQGFE